jgi:hypothetical protein
MSSEQSRYPFLSAKMFCAQVFSAASVNLAGVVAGHPLDTVKVSGTLTCISRRFASNTWALRRLACSTSAGKSSSTKALRASTKELCRPWSAQLGSPPCKQTLCVDQGYSVFTFTELINMRLKDSGFSAVTNKFISGAISAW